MQKRDQHNLYPSQTKGKLPRQVDICTEAEHFGRSRAKIHEEVPVRLGAHHLGSSNSITRNGMGTLIIIIDAAVATTFGIAVFATTFSIMFVCLFVSGLQRVQGCHNRIPIPRQSPGYLASSSSLTSNVHDVGPRYRYVVPQNRWREARRENDDVTCSCCVMQ